MSVIAKALIAGKNRVATIGIGSRSNRSREYTNTNPTTVNIAASPKLNAVTSANPNPTRPNAIELSKTTSAEGQGNSPPEIPRAIQLAPVMGSLFAGR